MNRSNKGFGLAGVLVTVIFLIVAAIFSASAKSSTLPQFSADYHSESIVSINTKL
ncbi:hypothetical protein [uncultured Paraglaciecola sp.]|uniref:hypothetical protein n=1 Tax=uncultured Paraglaciecola sp. TaxID=1765024 RepID=UPI0030D8E23C